MNTFINIEWDIAIHERDNYYVRIECFKKEHDGNITKYDCSLKSKEGCNLKVCDCRYGDNLKINLYDKYDVLIDQKEYNTQFSTIVITKNSYGILNISVK